MTVAVAAVSDRRCISVVVGVVDPGRGQRPRLQRVHRLPDIIHRYVCGNAR
jgi:hypothetical protein